MSGFRSFFYLVLMLPGLLAGCGQESTRSNTVVPDSGRAAPSSDTLPEKENPVRGSFVDQRLMFTDSAQVTRFFDNYPLLNPYRSDVLQFYGYRQFRFAWYDSSKLSEQAENLCNRLNNLAVEGIQTPPPYMKELDSLVHDPVARSGADTTLEVMLTAGYLYYADKVWNGISENETTKLQWYLPRKRLNLPYITDSLIRDTAAPLFADNYSNRQYILLKSELQKYRKLDSAGNWPVIASPQNALKPGDSAEVVRAIRKRLFLFGDLDTDSGSPVYDTSLAAGIRSFQQRYGLPVDGKLSAAFMKNINLPLSVLIIRLIVNMERMRWIPLNIAKHFLLINVPSFSLYAYDDDTVTFRMNVVVGQDMHKTVLFSGNLKYIVFSPYWNVPNSILKKEILPAIKKDPNYLSRNNMEWNGNTVRQKPGPKNSLGLVKFLFPNSYNIYLHDSPAKSLFNASTRAFSHGCIRLAEPAKLADYLLKDDSSWTPQKINKAMHSGVEKYVTLKNPVPVYIGYFTAFVDNRGRIQFRDDVYQRDAELEKMIIGK